jgi:membrane protein
MPGARTKSPYAMAKAAAISFIDDDAMTLGAALAFYTAMSMAPLVLILVAGMSLLGDQVQGRAVKEVQTAMGPQAGGVIEEIVQRGKQQKTAGTLSAIIGFAILLFSATGVFAQMQYSVNRVWNIQAKPGGGLWQWIRKRVLCLGMILAIGFMLLVSLLVSAALHLCFAGTSGILWEVVNVGASLIVLILAFAFIYKVLPDVQISWRDVWAGAILTGILFEIGRFLMGLYLGRSSVGSPYGAAGSLVVVLLWIYYASLIFFYGAELTQSWSVFHGRRLQPEQYAEETAGAHEKRQRELQEVHIH